MSKDFLKSLPLDAQEAIAKIMAEDRARDEAVRARGVRSYDEAILDPAKEFSTTFRMSGYERMLVDQVASQQGMSRSELIRQVLREALEKRATEAADQRPQTLEEQVAALRNVIQGLREDVQSIPRPKANNKMATEDKRPSKKRKTAL